jgi:hypothetical protein
MATLNGLYSFTPSTAAKASEVNANFNAVKAFVDAITTGANIDGSAITEAKINNAAVSEVKIANNAVTTDKINTGAVTTAKLADDSVTSPKIAAPTLTSKTDSFVLALVDENCTMQCNKATAMDVQIPTSGVAAFATGAIITLMQYGAGQVTVKPVDGSGVSLRSSNGFKLRTQYSMATLVKISNTEWVLSGDTVA